MTVSHIQIMGFRKGKPAASTASAATGSARRPSHCTALHCMLHVE